MLVIYAYDINGISSSIDVIYIPDDNVNNVNINNNGDDYKYLRYRSHR